MILGLALEKITGQNLNTALREKVLGPLGLHDTTDPAGTAAINSGQLLSPESYAQFASTDLRGKTTPVPGCGPGCFEQSVGYTYGLGVVITGNWLLQDPLFSGESAVEAYLPSQKVAIAVPVTHDPESFDSTPARTATSPTSSGARSRFRSRRRNPPPIK